MNAFNLAMAALTGLGLMLVVYWLVLGNFESSKSRQQTLEMAIDPSGFKDQTETELDRSFADRIIRPGLNLIGKLLTKSMPEARLRRMDNALANADGMWNLTAASMLGMQVIFGVLAFVASIFLLLQALGDPVQSTIGAILVGGFGFRYPQLKLARRTKARQRLILKELPNALDIIVVSIEAGLSLDAAFQQVAENFPGPIGHDFGVVLKQIRLGRPRREALRDLSEKANVAELSVLIDAILQSDQLGGSMANTLRVQAEEVRRKRRQRAEELGAKAPLKILFPMVGCIFPNIFLILLGPAALTVIHQMTGGH